MRVATRRRWLRLVAGLIRPGPALAGATFAGPMGSGRSAAASSDWPAEPWRHPPVEPGRALAFPRDFGAHPDYRTEWWYLTGWVDGRGFQITFFRTRTVHPQANPSRFAPAQLVFAHAALMVPAIGHPLHAERAARLGHPGTRVAVHDTDVAIGDWSLQRQPDDRYRIRIRDARFAADLRVDPHGMPPWLQGEAGFSRKGPQPEQASRYYSRPQLHIDGRIREPSPADGDAIAGRAPQRLQPRDVTGVAWFDHEWSTTLLDDAAAGWDWVGLNLDDGSAFVAFRIRRRDGGEPRQPQSASPQRPSQSTSPSPSPLWTYAARREPDGRTRILPDVRFTPLDTWRSPRTRAVWPIAMRIDADGRQWRLAPLFPDQELDSRASTGNIYWEGAVTVLENDRRIGLGYLELTGYHERLRL